MKSKNLTKLVRALAKHQKPDPSSKIKYGKPVYEVSFNSIKTISTIAAILLLINLLFAVELFASSVSIRNDLGYFINMIAGSEGDILPCLQALPVLFFTLINICTAVALYKIFESEKQPMLNCWFFLFIALAGIMLAITLILLIVILTHVYGIHEKLHNGIVDAMNNYSSNSMVKMQIDRLQIEFQCCGSKKYDEWYSIKWFDDSLVRKGVSATSEGNTPFSCCSMSSVFPCIHHDIETSGKVYLYTPEYNLSISTEGCYKKIRKKKQAVGWKIIGNLVLFVLVEVGLMICLRFLQTGHYEKSRFYDSKKSYTIWLFGYYIGSTETGPPEPPPVPPELMD